jgi:hypothetical protein
MPILVRLLPLVLVFAVAAPSIVLAQERTSQQQTEIKDLQSGIDDFFKGFNNPTVGPEQALNILMGKGPLKSKTTDLPELVKKAVSLEERYGRYTGHDFASVKTIGNDLVILRYLYKGERFPVVWHFYYYRPGNGAALTAKDWNLIEIRFDTNLDGLDR